MSTLTLSDNRILAYAEFGHPQGKPTFFFHGTPGSRKFRPPDETTARLGVRLICVDRPGYGESTFQVGRSLLDWPFDISQLADKLEITKFAVIGHSGGGPHALACASALPDRVTIAVTLSGAGPVNTPGATDGMTFLNTFGFKFGRYIPWVFAYLLVRLIFRERSLDPARAMDREIGLRPPADDELLLKPQIRQICLESEREAFRRGLKGMAWDVRLITRPWGFNLEEIKVPVHIWHGTVDNVTSVSMAYFMSRKIIHNRITICQDEGHLLLFPHWNEILTQLTSE